MARKLTGPVVVTGANGGLGLAVADSLLQNGATNCVFQYRSKSDRIAALLSQYGLSPKANLVQADLTLEQDVERLRNFVRDGFGEPWGLINLAGGSTNGLSWKLTASEFEAVLRMNLLSTFQTCRAFLPGMMEQGGGRIVNISSVVAHSGVRGASHYCAAKAGVEGFTRSIALECASKRVTVNTVALGYFDKGIISEVPQAMLDKIIQQIPVRRLGRAEEIFPLLEYLLSRESEYMTGQTIALNGGLYL